MEAEAWLDIVALLRLPFRWLLVIALLLLLVRSVSSVDPVCPVVVISTTGVSVAATSDGSNGFSFLAFN